MSDAIQPKAQGYTAKALFVVAAMFPACSRSDTITLAKACMVSASCTAVFSDAPEDKMFCA